MKYENAKDVLPKELFEEVQKYVSGKLLYFPIAGQRSMWGTKNGNRYKTEQRNKEIKRLYESGYSHDELSEKYYLTPESIKNIIYSKKGTKMNLDEILKLYSDNPPQSIERTNFIDEMKEWGDYYYVADYEVTYPERKIILHIHCYFFTTETRIKEQNEFAEAYRNIGCDVSRIIPNRAGELSCMVSHEGHECVVFAEEYRENTSNPSEKSPKGADGRYVYSDELLTLLGKIGKKHFSGQQPSCVVLFDSFSCGFSTNEDWIAEYTDGDLPNEIKKKQPDLMDLYGKINAELRRTRDELRPLYAKLPQSVFQFEEFWSSMLIDPEGHLTGLGNHTEGGIDVCINQFLCESMRRSEVLPEDYVWLAVHDPEINRLRIENVIHSMKVIGKEYTWNEDELEALPLLYKLMLFAVPYYYGMIFDLTDDHDKLKEMLEFILNQITSPDEIDFRKILSDH